MPVSDRLIKAVKDFEGFDSNAYWDAYGKVWTIGWGRTHGVNWGDTTTPDDEHDWLVGYLEGLQMRIRRHVRVAISELQEEALVSFAFNCGLGALVSSTLLRKLNVGDHAGAAKEFDRWIYAGQVVLNGLITRRAEERSWFERDDVSSHRDTSLSG